MPDKYMLDSQKLIYHTQRVAAWDKGDDICPIYMEVGLTNACNHRCIFCAFDYLNYQSIYLDTSRLKVFLAKAASRGLKSIMLAGEGEPLLHKDIVEIVNFAKECGLDIAITTNGVLLTKTISELLIPKLSWIKFSLDAATIETHTRIHNCNPGDYKKILANIKAASVIKKTTGSKCAIGVQFLLLPDNEKEVISAAITSKVIGADYFVVKPFTKHPMGTADFRNSVEFNNQKKIIEEFNRISDTNFSAIYRENAMSKLGNDKDYAQCYGFRFWAYLAANGDLYACSAFLGDRDFSYGNIYDSSLDNIWDSEKRKEVINKMYRLDVNKCREVCRLDEINRYLWEIKHPHEHVNFI